MRIRGILGRVALASAMLVAMVELGSAVAPAAHAQAECQLVPEFSDNMTAAVINPDYTVTGDTLLTGCDIGVYFGPGHHGTVSHASIHDEIAFGIVVDSAQVTIEDSSVSNILGRGNTGCGNDDETCERGEEMTSVAVASGAAEAMEQEYIGDKHGTGILVVGAKANATIHDSSISGYGRRGVSVTGLGAWASITNNTITGLGTGDLTHIMGQSGIWIANGGRASITRNTIQDNEIVGHGPASNGVMVAGGGQHNGQPNFTTRVEISNNRLLNNVIGVLLTNLGAGKVNPTIRTNNHVAGNFIEGAPGASVTPAQEGCDDGCEEEDGGMPPSGVFVAGGNGDTITGNTFSGYATLDDAIKVSERARDFIVVAGNKLS